MTNPLRVDGKHYTKGMAGYDYNTMYYCPKCGTKMFGSQESEE